MKKNLPQGSVKVHEADARDLESIFKEEEQPSRNQFDFVVIVGVAQYFNDEDFCKILQDIKEFVLVEGGKIFLKEQYNCGATTFRGETGDWVRSLECFKAAFRKAGFNATLVSRSFWDPNFEGYLSFVLD